MDLIINDWTNAIIQRWERVDRDVSVSYIQNNSSSRSRTQTYIYRRPGSIDF